MRIVSVNVGLPREVEWRGKTVRTSIFKAPVEGRVGVQRLNLDGDRQSDLTVHGGADKAVYVYPAEHYGYWQKELPGIAFPWGVFGENLTTEGLLEDDVHIGDTIGTGSAEFVVTQPRMPCFKLQVRFNRLDMVQRFLHSGRTGFYLRVIREGDIAAGDILTSRSRNENGVRVSDITRLYTVDADNQALLRRAVETTALPDGWRDYLRKRLWQPDSDG